MLIKWDNPQIISTAKLFMNMEVPNVGPHILSCIGDSLSMVYVWDLP